MKLGVIKSLKPMLSLLLPNDDLRDQVYDYIPLLLAEYQGSLEALFITQVRGLGWGLRVFRAPECPVGCSHGWEMLPRDLALVRFPRNICCCDKCVSHSVMSDSLRLRGLYPARILGPWDFPGKNTGVGCLFLLQGIFLAQKSKPGLPCCTQILYCLSHQGSQAERMVPQRVLGPTVRSQLS